MQGQGTPSTSPPLDKGKRPAPSPETGEPRTPKRRKPDPKQTPEKLTRGAVHPDSFKPWTLRALKDAKNRARLGLFVFKTAGTSKGENELVTNSTPCVAEETRLIKAFSLRYTGPV